MAKDKEPLKIVFAPGAFDTFEGTQEELDAFVAEITSTFEGKTAKEIESMSVAVDLNELWDEDPAFAQSLVELLEAQDTAESINKCKNAKAEAIHNAVYNKNRKLH